MALTVMASGAYLFSQKSEYVMVCVDRASVCTTRNVDNWKFKRLLWRSAIKYDKTEYKASIKLLNRALKYKPDSFVAYNNRGCAKFKLNNMTGALTDYNIALSRAKNQREYSIALCNRGEARAHLGEAEAAVTDCNTAIELNPHNSHAYTYRGLAHFNLGSLDKAMQDFDTALAMDNHDAEAYLYRARAKRVQKDMQGAMADINKAVLLKPLEKQHYYERGFIKHQLNDESGARADFEKGLKLTLGPNAPTTKGMQIIKLKRME